MVFGDAWRVIIPRTLQGILIVRDRDCIFPFDQWIGLLGDIVKVPVRVTLASG